jgi:tetratricopeptide (TPR) repeat protein
MLAKPIGTFKTDLEKVEYLYRMGRIYHEHNKLSKAIEYYELTVKTNFKGNEFLAANSCLQLGYIYQKLNFKQLAKTHFNKVFEYKNYDYKNYLQQQAKAALAKL